MVKKLKRVLTEREQLLYDGYFSWKFKRLSTGQWKTRADNKWVKPSDWKFLDDLREIELRYSDDDDDDGNLSTGLDHNNKGVDIEL